MSNPTDWSLDGDPPEAADMPSPTPEETEAIQEEVQKVRDAERKKIDDAVERGRSKASKASKASKDSPPDDPSSSATSRPTSGPVVSPGAA